MLSFFSISGFVNGITFAVLGLLVLLNNPKRKLNRLYALFSFSVVFWAISYGIWNLPQILSAKESALFWTRMLNFGSAFIPILFSHWCLTFLDIEKEKKNKTILTLGYLATLIFALFAFTPYYVSHVEPKLFFPYWPMPGVLYHFYLLICWGALLGYMFYRLYKAHKTASGYKREQVKYLLIGTILGFGGGATNYFLWYGISIAPWGNPLVATWAIFLSYAVLRYRFMDVRWVLRRTGIYALSLLTTLLYIFSLLFLNQRLGMIILPNALSVFIGVTSIFLFLCFFHFFEKLAGRYFYYTFYTLQTTLTDLSKKLNQTIELDKLTNLINRSLLEALKLDKIGIVLEETEKKALKPQQLIKFRQEDIFTILISQDNFLPRYLQKTKKPLVREEIPFLVKEKELSQKEKENLSFMEEELKKTEISTCLPLLVEEELIGIIILGNKLSQEAYTVQDLDLLTTITSQASVALNNALSYSEIEKRKADLEKFYKLTVGRELRMIELKKKIKELEEKLAK